MKKFNQFIVEKKKEKWTDEEWEEYFLNKALKKATKNHSLHNKIKAKFNKSFDK